MKANQGGIDWQAVKERLDNSERALQKALQPGAAQINAVYRHRAKRLAIRGGQKDAGKPVQSEAPKEATPVLSFWLGDELYAIPLTCLAEIICQPACAHVPGASKDLLGVVNLHGAIRPVLDAHAIFGPPRQEDGGKAGYIVFLRRQEGAEVGVKVDRIGEVCLVNEGELTVMGSEAGGLRGRFIKGVTKDAMIIINVREMLSAVVFVE